MGWNIGRAVAGVALACLLGSSGSVQAGYLDEVGTEVYGEVYKKLGVELTERVAHDPQVWMTLDQLKRESCDQKAINDLGILLERLGFSREAALSQYNFVKNCGAPTLALNKSTNLLLKLSDYAMAVEVADEYVRRSPTTANAHYLRAMAFQGLGDYNRAIADYSEAIDLFGADRSKIGTSVFLRMAESYAKLGRYCEAMTPIWTWVAIDPVRRDNERSRKIIEDYERRGNCAASNESHKERYASGANRLVKAPALINGVRGIFIIDTGASYVSVKKAFADKAKVSYSGGTPITLHTANGPTKGRLTKADGVKLGRLAARDVPLVVQDGDQSSYGAGVDGLLGMSFLSRYELQVAGGFIEIRTRARKH
jgi:aspartyl protease family protein